MHYILHYDKSHYVYMRDVQHDHTLFAIQMDEHEHMLDTVLRFNYEYDEVPDDYTIEVIEMTEISDDVYEINEDRKFRYPINLLNYALAMPYEQVV